MNTRPEESGPSSLHMEGRAQDDSHIYMAARDMHYYASSPPATPPAVIRTLLADVPEFVGRSAELVQLIQDDDRARVLSVYAVDGMAGVGKTALVTKAGHLLADRFPDGQVFVQLRAHSPTQQPADPSEILADLLAHRGIPPQFVPATLDARAAMWRDQLAEKKILLILDDAVSRSQIEPLLPSSKDARVLITSRRLLALPGAKLLPLGVLPAKEAVQLFLRVSRRSASGAKVDAVGSVVAHCGYLPLAITVLAARLAHRPAYGISQFAAEFAELAEVHDRLGELEADESSLATAFALSYRDLNADEKRLFRRCGLHPGSEIDAYSAAALDDISLLWARRRLSALRSRCLIDEPAAGRYRMHDLVREYACGLVAQDSVEECKSATSRLLNYYCRTAESANLHLIHRSRASAATPSTQAGATPTLPTRDDALAWMRTERPNLIACISRASMLGRHAVVVDLAGAIAAFLQQEGPWPEAAAVHHDAAAAARHSGDALGEADALFDLATAQRLTGNHPAAINSLEQALTLYRAESPVGEAGALSELGVVRRLTRDHEEAQQLLEEALAIYRACKDRQGEADTLHELGRLRFQTGQHRAMVDLLTEALKIYRSVGDRRGQARVFHGLGAAEYQAGDYTAASALYGNALKLSRAFGFRLIEANTYFDLSHVEYRTGASSEAIDLLERAVDLYRALGFTLGEANALYDLGTLHSLSDEDVRAVKLLERAVQLYSALGSRIVECNCIYDLGRVRSRLGDRSGAIAALESALTHHQEIGDSKWHGEVRSAMGSLLALPVGPQEARALYERVMQTVE
ncbi:tetratricopeptide repeat protein [Streptomyces griseorubiginosus]|uniref:ATP-binding protein n=1 Tax=Streptomyces griseorubiginosus TaxID=67304 RepID=UPI0036E650AD